MRIKETGKKSVLPAMPSIMHSSLALDVYQQEGDPLKIAVCIKAVPDTETKIQIAADKLNIDFSGVRCSWRA